jgi:EF-P beta-lysylation protein EpmB
MTKQIWREQSKNQASSQDFTAIKDYHRDSEKLFRLHIPEFFKNNINFTNSLDPLLMQVLPSIDEIKTVKNYSDDPVGDIKSKKSKGVIHKYLGRVLLIATGSCAINCRYCFRRSFPYSQNNASANNWSAAINYISNNKDLHEVILSGGDPLMLSTKVLSNFTSQLKDIEHIKTLRIHTRIPLVCPSRITDNFIKWLDGIPLKKVMVLHSNHPKELQPELKITLNKILSTQTLLLNQSVLLKGINDNANILAQLSFKLFDLGVLPYYLNHLDKVQGAAHFQVKNKQAKRIHKQLLAKLPGYLVPKLVEEIQGKKNKSPLN